MVNEELSRARKEELETAFKVAGILKEGGWKVGLQIFAGHDWIIPSVENLYKREGRDLEGELRTSFSRMEELLQEKSGAEGVEIIEMAEINEENERFRQYTELKRTLLELHQAGKEKSGKESFTEKVMHRAREAESIYFRSAGNPPQRMFLAIRDMQIRRASALFLSREAAEKTADSKWGVGVILTTESSFVFADEQWWYDWRGELKYQRELESMREEKLSLLEAKAPLYIININPRKNGES
ncbi:MAG TPA: hypothetical protein VMX77_00320 [Candidatus Bathyarchaeia archaeon]|nr:hypothetical protein [Candidatus Bathyarchaeia archaeon]